MLHRRHQRHQRCLRLHLVPTCFPQLRPAPKRAMAFLARAHTSSRTGAAQLMGARSAIGRCQRCCPICGFALQTCHKDPSLRSARRRALPSIAGLAQGQALHRHRQCRHCLPLRRAPTCYLNSSQRKMTTAGGKGAPNPARAHTYFSTGVARCPRRSTATLRSPHAWATCGPPQRTSPRGRSTPSVRRRARLTASAHVARRRSYHRRRHCHHFLPAATCCHRLPMLAICYIAMAHARAPSSCGIGVERPR